MKVLSVLFISVIFHCLYACHSSIKQTNANSGTGTSDTSIVDSTSTISSIKNQVQRIDGVAKWSRVVEKELDDTAEGGLASYYYNGLMLEKIVVQNYGETFQSTLTYYVVDDELVCYSEEKLIYNRPIYYDEEAMQENGDTTFFDIEKSKKTKYVYYFDKGKVVNQTSIGGADKLELDDVAIQSIYQNFVELKK